MPQKLYTSRKGTSVLIEITSYDDIDTRKLMDLYAESNIENADYFYPDMANKSAALALVEEGFLNFLKTDFFVRPNSTYYILEEDGVWVSALRLSLVEKHECSRYYMEALETRPCSRRKGYASKLLNEVIASLKHEGSFILCDCVSKHNEPSLKTHLKCGFQIASTECFDYLQNQADHHCYGMEYRFIH